jgi:acyl-CoA thioester hydrolase
VSAGQAAPRDAADALKPLASLSIPVRWRDLDAFDHVNNATYLTYLEEARLHWFAQIDGDWKTDTVAPVVAAINANYRRQLGWPASIVVELNSERLGNTSLTIAFRIVDERDRGIVYADGNTVLVWVDATSGGPVALPAAVRAAATK